MNRRRPAFVCTLAAAAIGSALVLAAQCCGRLPSSYPLYGATGITINSSGSVNGHTVGAGSCSNCAVAGTSPVSALLVLSRASARDGAYDYLNVGVSPQDSDTVALLSGVLNLDADANGEMISLVMPLMAGSFICGGFNKNHDDSCTNEPISNITFGQYTRQLRAGAVSALNRTLMAWGDAGLRLLAPGLGHQGSVRVTASQPAWLQYLGPAPRRATRTTWPPLASIAGLTASYSCARRIDPCAMFDAGDSFTRFVTVTLRRQHVAFRYANLVSKHVYG
jgi:hypothetical protein